MVAAFSPFSPEVEASRRQGLGASEIGQVIGIHPYGGPHAIWLEKTGRAKPFEGNEHTRYGQAMEAGIMALYAHATGHKVEPGEHVVHPKYPIVRATPDVLVNSDRIAQIKCTGHRVTQHGTWGEPGTHDFPRWLWAQITWEMAATGRPWADVVVLIHGHVTPIIYPDCPFDRDLFERMLEAAQRFWRDHVLADKAPPLDGTPASTDWIKEQYPQNTRPTYVVDDSADMAQLAAAYVAAKEAAGEAERVAKMYQNQIAARIGEAAGIEGTWGGISYTTARRANIDYKSACRDRGISEADLARYSTETIYRQMRVRAVK